MIGISYQKTFFIIYRRRMARNFWLTTKLQQIPFDSSTIRMICSIFSTHLKLTFGKNMVHLSCQFHLKNAGKCYLGWENTIQKTSKPTHMNITFSTIVSVALIAFSIPCFFSSFCSSRLKM